MQPKSKSREESVGAMHKQRETMADGRRYLIYYTFDGENKDLNTIVDPPTADSEKEGNNV